VERLRKVVERSGLDLVSVAVAWVIGQEGVTSAIIGASRAEQLASSLAAPDLELDAEVREACEALWWELPRRPVLEGYR
jgi:aryl-alcohol dehydrogenase-like predicted oxidoreductase